MKRPVALVLALLVAAPALAACDTRRACAAGAVPMPAPVVPAPRPVIPVRPVAPAPRPAAPSGPRYVPAPVPFPFFGGGSHC